MTPSEAMGSKESRVLAGAVREGDEWVPRIIADDFERPNSSSLGRTSVGNLLWTALRGEWSISSHRAYVPTSTVNPISVVETRASNVDITLDVSNSSGDGIAFRAKDANNFLRAYVFYSSSTETTYVTEYGAVCFVGAVEVDGVNHSHDMWCWTRVEGEFCCPYTTGHVHPEGDHGDYLMIPGMGERTVASGTITTITRSVILQRVENGSVTTLQTWGTSSGLTGDLKVELRGSDIDVYRGSTLVGSHVTAFNQNETKHGLSRGTGGVQATRINHFFLVH